MYEEGISKDTLRLKSRLVITTNFEDLRLKSAI